MCPTSTWHYSGPAPACLMRGCFPPSPVPGVNGISLAGSPGFPGLVSYMSPDRQTLATLRSSYSPVASQVDLPGFHSLQFTTSTLSAFPFSGGIKKMTLNCLQNKTAALSLELDKEASENTEMMKWRVKGMGGVIKSKN